MKNIHDIKTEKQSKVDQLITDCRVFFAFSDDQFNEGVRKVLKEGEKVARMGAGGFIPSCEAQKFMDGMDNINKWYKAEIKANKGARRANIAYELANHESYYTGDISAARQALGKNYTTKEVLKVYNEERTKQHAEA